MSKKNFKQSPALQFVSRANVANEEEKGAETAEGAEDVPLDDYDYSYRAGALQTETKSKRFNLLIRPSAFVALQKMAKNRGLSANELINKIIAEYLERS